MIALHEGRTLVLGITHPAIVAPRQRGGPAGQPARSVAPAALPSLLDAARETVAYRDSDFTYTNYSDDNADRFRGYMAALLEVGGSARTHPFLSKVPIIHGNEAAAVARIHGQLDAGHAGVILQEVESADEVRTALAAMKFRSQGGTRPDEHVGLAAAYWGVTPAEYRKRASPWPLDKQGELVLWAIVESRTGIEHVREIAAVPGLTVLTVGAGTLGGVFSTTGPDGQRVLDRAGFDAAIASIASACREFKVACSHPANTPADIERLTKQGFTVFTMQARNADGFAAIAAGRKLDK
ncbi:MAG: hypothetical protein IT178_09345 [Acidobacteria bacterium]|nr:hypothetical protein [Acidobacteriota bacterium]